MKELIEIIYISRIPTDRTSVSQFHEFLAKTEQQLNENISKFKESKDQYHLLSDEMKSVLDDILYGENPADQGGSIAYLLGDLYDSDVRDSEREKLKGYISYLEQYFRYFMFYWHYNLSGGEEIFLYQIEKTEKNIKSIEESLK